MVCDSLYNIYKHYILYQSYGVMRTEFTENPSDFTIRNIYILLRTNLMIDKIRKHTVEKLIANHKLYVFGFMIRKFFNFC